LLGEFLEKKRKQVHAGVADAIERYKEDHLALVFVESVDQSVVFDQWSSIATNLKNGLSMLRHHIYERREEYSSVIISYNKSKHAFVVISFTVGRWKRSEPWSVNHHISEYRIPGKGPESRNKTALEIASRFNIKEEVSASFL